MMTSGIITHGEQLDTDLCLLIHLPSYCLRILLIYSDGLLYLILYPFFCSQFGLDNIRILYNSTWLAHGITHIFGDITVSLPAGAETYVLTILIEIWVRIYYRISCISLKH